MTTCTECGFKHRWNKCPACGTPVVSVGEDTLDSLVQRASLPNLGSLFKKGKASGLIGSVSNYGEGAPSQ